MKAQILVDVVLIYVAPTPSLLYYNNVGVTHVGTFNFKMELVTYVPLYYVAMFQFMIKIIEAPFVITPIHIVVGMKFRP
jgi:hypothetical protein